MSSDLVLLNYNDSKTTIEFLEHIKNIEQIDHVVIVDNLSTDGSYELLKKYETSKIDVIQTNKNGGYAYGNNYGIKYLLNNYNSKFIIVSNPDVIITKSNIESMLDVYSKYDNVGIVTCKMKCTSNINLPIAWKIPNYKDCLIDNLFVLKKILGEKIYYSDKELTGDICKVDVLPGSLFMISSDVFKKTGGFDENTFLYYEENILAQKLRKLKLSNYLINNIQYIHNHSVSINKSIKKVNNRLKINFKSKMYYCKEYLKIGKIKQLLLLLTFYLGLFSYSVFNFVKRK